MNEHNTTSRRGRIASTLSRTVILALLLSFAVPGFAATQLDEKNRLIKVKLDQPMNTETTDYGDPFEATIVETYQWGDKQLPEGTTIKGKVQAARPSMMFGMPGYVSVDIQEARLPSGSVFDFDTTGSHPKSQKYHHPKAPTGVRVLKAAVPFGMISAMNSVPLTLATSMSNWQIFPISLAIRMAAGVGYEMKYRDRSPVKDYPVQTRVGFGMIRGTGLNGVYQLIVPGREPDLRKGSVIEIQLPQKDLDQLFIAGVQSGAPNSDTVAEESKPEDNTAKAAPITDPLPRPEHSSSQTGENSPIEKSSMPAITLPPHSPSPISAVKQETESSKQ